MLHRFAKVVVGCTVLLVLAGSLVTSTGSGLSVPDWPTSYGWNLFTFQPSRWVGGIPYEDGKVNRSQPYEVGQSGTERPEPVLESVHLSAFEVGRRHPLRARSS